MTFGFDIAYWMGFVILLAETVNVNVIGVYFRYKANKEKTATDNFEPDLQQLFSACSNYMYWFLSVLLLGATIF